MEKSLLHELVSSAHREKLYRPVAVGVIRSGPGRPLTLCVNSAKNPDDWGFVQGGIEPGEAPDLALVREIAEETGIRASQLSGIHYLGWRDLDAEATRADKRGFTRGKRYLFYAADYEGPMRLRLARGELASYAWLTRQEAVARFFTTRQARRQMLLDFLGRA